MMQGGVSRSDMANVELVADIKELEDLLNDKIAKQRVTLKHWFDGFLRRMNVAFSISNDWWSSLLDNRSKWRRNRNYSSKSNRFFRSTEVNEKPRWAFLSLAVLQWTKTEFQWDGIQWLWRSAWSTGRSRSRFKIVRHQGLLHACQIVRNETERIEWWHHSPFDSNSCRKAITEVCSLISIEDDRWFSRLPRGKKKLAQLSKDTKEQLAALQSKLDLANAGKDHLDDLTAVVFSPVRHRR